MSSAAREQNTVEFPSTPEGVSDFIHLRLHTAYSLAEGAIHVKKLPALCQEHSMPALGITDTNNLFGALEFATTLSKEGIQPIIGGTVSVDIAPLIAGDDKAARNTRPGLREEEHLYPIALIAKNETGFENLMALVSNAYNDVYSGAKPHTTLEELAKHRDGLIALTGGRHGPIDQLLLKGQKTHAQNIFQRLIALFPDHLYVELQRHDDDVSRRTESALIEFAYAYDVPLVATNEPYFATADMAIAHDALLCIAQGAYLAQDDRFRLTPEHYFKSPDEMKTLFHDLPEAIENTVVIARRCSYMPKLRDPILPRFDTGDGLEEADELRRQAEEGLRARLDVHGCAPGVDEKEYWDRLHFELDIIIKMDFPGYFLIVADFIKWSKDHDIPVGPGRGSGAGSIIAWALTITDLDPLRFALLFERFLNPERVSMPDFDIDFCQERRDEVISYVQKKYGHDRVAQIITLGKLQARAVVRDVGRVLQMPYGQVDRICKLIPNNPANPVTLAQAIESEIELQVMRDNDETVERLMEIALKLEGLYRHASTHAAGVVIGDRPLEELVPTYRDPRSDMPVTQYNMKWVEPAGLVKFDFLGLKTLTVLKKAEQFLHANGVEIDIERLPLDDEKTYQMMGRGETVGIFQFESAGMRDLLRQARPSNIEDLIALVALFRPGPMENISLYLDNKHGRVEPDYMHDMIKPILLDTYGIMIYQEQVMQVAQVLSGYSLGEADLLRRAMGKKIQSEMDEQKARFVDGAVEKGVDKKQAAKIFDQVNKFAGYGFNKSHSACYAYVAYQTAYLKANYPVEFYAASMSLDKGNTDKLNVFKGDAIDADIEIVPPCVNRSQSNFAVEDGKILYALSAIKNVGEAAMQHVVDVREEGGPFQDLFDFAQRIDPQIVNKRAFENLAKAGAFDKLHPNRAQTMKSVDVLLSFAQQAAQDRNSPQVSLFGEESVALENPPLPFMEEWEPIQKLQEERDAIGFFLSGHPLDDYMSMLRRKGVLTYAELKEQADQQTTIAKLAGVISARNNRRSQKGDRPFAFLELSDPSGNFEMIIFSDLLAADGDKMLPGEAVAMTVAVDWKEDTLRLNGKAVQLVDDVTADAVAGFRVFVEEEGTLDAIRLTLDAARERAKKVIPGPGTAPGTASGIAKKRTRPCQVNLVLMIDKGAQEMEVELPERYPISPSVKGALKALPGVMDVQDM